MDHIDHTAQSFRELFESEDEFGFLGAEVATEFEEFARSELRRYDLWGYDVLKTRFVQNYHYRREREKQEREVAERERKAAERRREEHERAAREIETELERRKAEWIASGGTEVEFEQNRAGIKAEILKERMRERRAQAATVRTYF
jgi:hypothetical protein